MEKKTITSSKFIDRLSRICTENNADYDDVLDNLSTLIGDHAIEAFYITGYDPKDNTTLVDILFIIDDFLYGFSYHVKAKVVITRYRKNEIYTINHKVIDETSTLSIRKSERMGWNLADSVSNNEEFNEFIKALIKWWKGN